MAATRASAGFLFAHPAHLLALGFGTGFRRAPGTVGTLWAWVAFLVLDRWLDDAGWAFVIGAGLLAGTWACTRAVQHLGVADPARWSGTRWSRSGSCSGSSCRSASGGQAGAFALFRYFDAAKPGPVGWADRLQAAAGRGDRLARGFGIMFDDLVAAGCTLLFVALWVAWNW